jgi:cysteine desulfurase/selenocysteine lyase
MCDFYSTSYSNVHRGIYPLSESATSRYEAARHTASRFINADLGEVVFVRSTTEAINLVTNSWSKQYLKQGDTILVTVMEHHSNFVPWQQIAKERGAHFSVIEIDDFGRLDLDGLESELKRGVKLLACTMVSNVLGTINPIREIADLAHRYGAVIVVDGAQAVSRMPVDVKDLDVDFFAFSGHKAYGPTGIGVLYGRRAILDCMPPFMLGGEMVSEVLIDQTRFNEPPLKFEAGTPPIMEAIGLARAIDYVNEAGLDNIMIHEKELIRYAYRMLHEIHGVTIYGPPLDERVGILTFNISGIHPHDMAGILGNENICIRAGQQCAQPLHEFLGISASARLSLGLYNTREDLDIFIEHVERVKDTLTKT